MRGAVLIPAAIVTGCTIIAVGLFLGLRGGPGPIGSGAATELGPVPLPAPIRNDAWGMGEVANALEARKPALVKTCWKPALERAPTPATSRYRYAVSFDAQGKQLAQGISEAREASRSDVAECLRAQPMELVIPPPGRNFSTEVWLVFP